MKIKYLFIILIFLGTVAVSYFYSGDIYKFQLTVYHKHIKRKKPEDFMASALNLYKQKEYGKSLKILNTASTIFGTGHGIKQLSGLNHIRLGRDKFGADLIIDSLPGGDVKPEVFKELIEILFKHRYYGDIVGAADKYRKLNDHLVKYYYGISLYKVNKYTECIGQLSDALDLGANRFTQRQQALIHLYLGLAYEGLKRMEPGLKHLISARNLDRRNREINQSLVRIFRKMGKLDMAEKILRRQ